MTTDIIANPELNKLYLLRRNRGGAIDRRYQPGIILEIHPTKLGEKEPLCKVRWTYDEVVEDNVLMFYGFVKELSDRWLDAENKRLDAELQRLKLALWHVNNLRFKPLNPEAVIS